MASCPFCLKSVEAEALSCPNCRARLSRLCPFCAEEISSIAATCKYCGANLSVPGVSATPGVLPAYAASPPPAYATLAPMPGLPPPPIAPPPLPEHVPFEDKSLAWGTRFWQTCKGTIAAPVELFQRMPKKGGHGAPVIFALVLSLGTALISLATCQLPLFLLQESLIRMQEKSDPQLQIDRDQIHRQVIINVASTALQPVWTLAFLYVFGGLVHLTAMLFGSKAPFECTVRAVAYAQGPMILCWVPFVGGSCLSIVAGIWSLVLTCIAIGKLHGIGGGKGTGAVLLPASLLLVLFCGGAILAGLFSGFTEARHRRTREYVPPPPRSHRTEQPDEPEPSDPENEMNRPQPPGGEMPAPRMVPESLRGEWLLDRRPSS